MDVMMQAEKESNSQLYKSLLKDYEDALYQLAEARLHIDRLRFGGAHVNIHKHFILTHSMIQQQHKEHSTAEDENDNGLGFERAAVPRCDITTGDPFVNKRTAAVKGIIDLQNRLQALHERTEHSSDISLDEVQSELMDIHQMHQKLATDLAVMMDAADNDSRRTSDADPENMKIKHELMILAQQLQDFITLLQDKEETILNTTMRKRRSSSDGMNTHTGHQQIKNDSIGDMQQYCSGRERVEEGWIDGRKEKSQTPGEGLLTPPYTPLTKNPSNNTTIERDHHTNDTTNRSNHKSSSSSSRKSKIPVYNGNSIHRSPTEAYCCSETAYSTASGDSCSNLSQQHNNDDDDQYSSSSPLKTCKKTCTFSQPLETTCIYHPTTTTCSKCSCCKRHSETCDKHKLQGDLTKKVSGVKGRSLTPPPPTIIIDHDSSTLRPPTSYKPSLSSPYLSPPPHPYNKHRRPATCTCTCTANQHSNNNRDYDLEKKKIDKSVTAIPKMTDKGIQVDPSLVSQPLTITTTPVKGQQQQYNNRRKKKHHKRRLKQIDSSLLSSDESFVTLIEPKDFFKTLTNNNNSQQQHHHYIRRRHRSGSSYKGKENPGISRGSGDSYYGNPLRKERRKSTTGGGGMYSSSSSRKKKPLQSKVTGQDYTSKTSTILYNNESTSLESATNDTLSSSSDTTLVNNNNNNNHSISSRHYKVASTNYRHRPTHKSSCPSMTPLHGRNNDNNSRVKFDDCSSSSRRRPHSDTSMPLYTSRPILCTTSHRPVPIPNVSRPVPIPSRPVPIPSCHGRHYHQKEQRKASLNLDEAIDLAEKLKKSSKIMNSALLHDTYLPRYSV